MSLSDGWAALKLEMPPRVPRTEYSVQGHRDLIREVTGRSPIPRRSSFVMAVGNHIPANTPVENPLYYNEVFEQLRSR